MSIRIHAIPPDMYLAATRLNSGVTSFESSTQATRAAAEKLAANWEGDSREAFVAEQREANRYYIQMAKLVRAYLEKVRRAANLYEDTDSEGARTLQRAR